MLVLIEVVTVGFMIRLRVAIESHPTELVNVTEYEPAVL